MMNKKDLSMLISGWADAVEFYVYGSGEFDEGALEDDEYPYSISARCSLQSEIDSKNPNLTKKDLKTVRGIDTKFKKKFIPSKKFCIVNPDKEATPRERYWFAYGLPSNASKEVLSWMRSVDEKKPLKEKILGSLLKDKLWTSLRKTRTEKP